MAAMYWAAVLLIAGAGCVAAQETAQSSVARELRECYMNATLVNRNNLPPATIPILIDIIRKIENNPDVQVTMRELAVLLLHTYRQDGIEFHQPESMAAGSNVMPFAPTFHSFHRHRLLLTRIIPGNLRVLANNTLPSTLKCALHYMLSITVDGRVRGDESNCNQLSQYRALRVGRSVKDEVESFDPILFRLQSDKGQLRQYNPDDDVEGTDYRSGRSERQLLGDSQCPLQGGVVNSGWGALSAGNLIAGIAAGAQAQQVPVLELAKGSVINYNNVQQFVTAIYPATLTGDLAEAILIQGTDRGLSNIQVGSTGGWNSTQATRYYMLSQRTNIEMTDPEIRGGLDGFILGQNYNTFDSLRLSQVLDMYYSPRNGLLNQNLRACNRRVTGASYLTDTTLANEAYAFAAALDTNLPLRGTIVGGLDGLVTNAVTNLQNYITNNLNDLNCMTTENTFRDYRLRKNLYIVLDSTWQYQAVYPAISHLLDVIDVNPFGSSITLLSAFDGSVVINTTFSIADFHSEYTLTRHQSMLTGVSLQNSLANIVTMMHSNLDNERARNYAGGNSTVMLYLLYSGTLQNDPQAVVEARKLNETVPDLRLLFATATNQLDNLGNLVRDMHADVITVSLTTAGTNVEVTMAEVVDRVQQVARRIINPICGSTFQDKTLAGTRMFEDNVEPGYINFYSISPNYFYESSSNRRVRITRTGAGAGNLIVCHSRTVTQPRQNATGLGLDENAIQCLTLATGNVEISLRDACDGFSTINSCPLFYISVQSTGGQAVTTTTCTDNSCRFPYNIRYQVATEDLGCFSSASGVAASFLFVITALVLHLRTLL